MSEKYKTYPGGLFFVTLTIVGWIDVFTRREYADDIIKNLNFCSKHKGLKVYAYCIMPSHIHMIASPENGLLSGLLRDFKSYTSKQLIQLIKDNPVESRKDWLLYMFTYFAKHNKHNTEYQFWQNGNHPIDLTTTMLIEQKVDYIHQNPVAAGLVTEAHCYVFSSANPDNLVILETI
jgi:putative transposase